MWVYKRDGRKEPVAFDKITARVSLTVVWLWSLMGAWRSCLTHQRT